MRIGREERKGIGEERRWGEKEMGRDENRREQNINIEEI